MAGQSWMQEFTSGLHAQALHQAPRALVRHRREGDDLLEPEVPECEIEARLRGFPSETLSPMCGPELPADLDARRERGLEGHRTQADEAEQLGRGAWGLDPKAEAPLREVGVDLALKGQ